jgi:predicted O-methyltransferase YrrM
MNFTIEMTPELLEYIYDNGVREHPVLTKCRQTTLADEPFHMMQIAPEQGALMALLTQLLGVRNALEIGTFTGYSALAVTLAMGKEGRLTVCDISEEFVNKARAYWQEAGVADQIETHIGPAADSLKELIAQGREGSYDMAFIDADKTGYDTYYESALTLLRPGGLICIDNVLWAGSVADRENTSEDTVALRQLNAKIYKDERVDIALVPIADGIMMCRKR